MDRPYARAGGKSRAFPFERTSKTQRSVLISPSAGPGYCQEAAQQSEGMPSEFADENLYSLVSEPQRDISRGPRYRSKVRPERCIHVHLLGTLATLT